MSSVSQSLIQYPKHTSLSIMHYEEAEKDFGITLQHFPIQSINLPVSMCNFTYDTFMPAFGFSSEIKLLLLNTSVKSELHLPNLSWYWVPAQNKGLPQRHRHSMSFCGNCADQSNPEGMTSQGAKHPKMDVIGPHGQDVHSTNCISLLSLRECMLHVSPITYVCLT